MPFFESQRAYSKFKSLDNLGGTGETTHRGQTLQIRDENGRDGKISAAVRQNSDTLTDVAIFTELSRQPTHTIGITFNFWLKSRLSLFDRTSRHL